jgi:hypothetical protein
MNQKRYITGLYITVIIAMLVLSCGGSYAQMTCYSLERNYRKISVPFELCNNLVVVPVTMNDTIPLKFILDTGVETSILTEPLIAELLHLRYDKEINIKGPGNSYEVTAYLVNQVRLSMPGAVCTGVPIYVLAEDYLQLKNVMGVNVHGILGSDIFRRFVVDLDYSNKVMTLWEPSKYVPPRKCHSETFDIIDNKPYINVILKNGENIDTTRLLLDLGASHAIMLTIGEDSPFRLPDKYITQRIGQGIAGEIPGYIGRTSELYFGGFKFENVITSFTDSGYYDRRSVTTYGSIGSDILSRFRLIIDYPHNKVYLKKNHRFSEEFTFNQTGIEIAAEGVYLNEFTIIYVRPGSSADLAGIKEGDKISSIDHKQVLHENLDYINHLLMSVEKDYLILGIVRDKKDMMFRFKVSNDI